MAASTTSTQNTKASSSVSTMNTPSTPNSANNGRQRGAMNGVAGRGSATKSGPAKETNTPDKHANDRLSYLLASFVGSTAHITVKSGEVFTGVFSSASLPRDPAETQYYVLKMVKRLAAQPINGHAEISDEYIGHGEDHVFAIDVKDVVDLSVADVCMTDKIQAKLTNGTSTSFRTDTDISGNAAVRERELKPWEPAASDISSNLSFNASTNTTWDQFETNERLYGVKTDYNENFYTTVIDRTAPAYKQRAADADRVAREIERTATNNTHVAEERGQVSQNPNGLDEEDRFSGVKRDSPSASSQSNKYTPPARRAPTGHATVPGAPFDPAIISAQLVRPGSAAKTSKSANVPMPATEQPSQKKENVEPIPEVSQMPRIDISSEKEAELASVHQDKSSPSVEKVASPLPSAVTTRAAGRGSIATPNPLPNATANVEHDVYKAFRNFAQHEKDVILERQRLQALSQQTQQTQQRKDFEMKKDDLRKFSTVFKLKTAVPQDMLGILAKDKHKQIEIVEKSQRDLDGRSAPKTPVAPQPDQIAAKSPGATRDGAQLPTPAGVDKQTSKSARTSQMPQIQTSQNGRPDRVPQPNTVVSPRAGPGNLGQRLMAQSQYRDRPMQSVAEALPSRTMPDGPSRNGSASNAMSARLNVQAMEFRPNPTAVSFSPTSERASPLRARTQSTAKKVNRVSFFGNKKPTASERSIKDAFNPITRMKDEVIQQNRVKEHASNGGIPQSYKTPPVWDVSEENKEKSYVDMFDKSPAIAQTLSPTNMPLPHQHQLPLHLQQSSLGVPQSGPHQPVQQFPPQMHNQGRDHRFEEQRMQFSTSQSSQFSSPRMNQVMLPYGQQILGQMPGPLGQPMSPYPYGVAAQALPRAQFAGPQFIGPQGGPLQGALVMNQFMPVHGHAPMFSPSQGHGMPGHVIQNGPNGFASPRGAPMMMQQVSQQGHGGPPNFFYQPGGYPGQVYGQVAPGQAPPMRGGGIPMVKQPSFGGNNHFPQQHFPNNQRGFPQTNANYGHQPVAMDQGMSQQNHPPPTPMNQMNQGGDSESK